MDIHIPAEHPLSRAQLFVVDDLKGKVPPDLFVAFSQAVRDVDVAYRKRSDAMLAGGAPTVGSELGQMAYNNASALLKAADAAMAEARDRIIESLLMAQLLEFSWYRGRSVARLPADTEG